MKIVEHDHLVNVVVVVVNSSYRDEYKVGELTYLSDDDHSWHAEVDLEYDMLDYHGQYMNHFSSRKVMR